MAKSERLSAVVFGQRLLESRDLDPVYVLLWNAELPHDRLCSWLVAYFCFYHCGTASWISDKTDSEYWNRLLAAASTKEHPRASERRHFRGGQAIKAVEELRSRLESPSELINGFRGGSASQPSSLAEVVARVKALRGFGDWVAFKVADLLERLGMAKVNFMPNDVFSMYESPRKGAELLAEQQGYKGTPYLWAYNYVKRGLAQFTAPPRYERPINIQEVETILCKYHSHCNGHYEVGKDIIEVQHALEKYKHIPVAHQLLKAGVEASLWKHA